MIDEELEIAKRQTLHFLSFRLRSVEEVRTFLGKKNHPPELIQKAVDELAEHEFLDDRKFADWWAESRKKQGWGQVKIENELKMKGVEKKIIRSVTACDWKIIIQQEIGRYSGKFKGLAEREKNKKIRETLARKGFTWNQIRQSFDDIAING